MYKYKLFLYGLLLVCFTTACSKLKTVTVAPPPDMPGSYTGKTDTNNVAS